MAKQVVETREMVLGQTDGYRYIGVRPSLTGKEIELLPIPIGYIGHEEIFEPSVTTEDDGSMTIGFEADAAFREFDNVLASRAESSSFVQYAVQTAARIGGISLDGTLRYVGPGSMFTPDNLEDPVYPGSPQPSPSV